MPTDTAEFAVFTVLVLDPGNAHITLAAADLTGDLGRIPKAI